MYVNIYTFVVIYLDKTCLYRRNLSEQNIIISVIKDLSGL